jgi:uncharacterized protein YdiU (UPF0061 family)
MDFQLKQSKDGLKGVTKDQEKTQEQRELEQKHEQVITEVSKLLSGNVLFKGSKPLAHCYCGHQFGYFSG